MPDNREIEILLKNIQSGLKKYSIKELNDAISSFLNNDKEQEIEYIFQIVCDDFNTIPRRIKANNTRGILNEAKQIIYCLLYFDLGLPLRQISSNVFSFSNHNSVYTAIKRLRSCDVNLKEDRIFLERYNKMRNKFLNYFSKEQITNEH